MSLPGNGPSPEDVHVEPNIGNPTPPARPHRWFTISLAMLLLSTVAARFIHLEVDPPYEIISTSGAFLTDEGWYSKSAQLHARFGDWTNANDLVWYSHNILFTVLQTWAFDLCGISLIVARLLSVIAFCVSLGSFYLICRTTQTRVISLVTCLLVSMTLQNMAYSRLALIEPVGVAFSLVALCLWVRFPRSLPGAVGAMLCAGAAFFTKIAFLYTMIAVGMLIVGDALMLWRERRRGRAIGHVVIVAVLAIAVYATHRWVVAWSAADGAIFEKWHVTGRAKGIDFVAVALHEIKMLFKLTYATGAPTLTCSLGFGLLFLGIKQRLHHKLPWTRGTTALMLWGLGGCSFFGLFLYQPPRYYYFALFPLIYATMMVAREVSGTRHWRLASLFLLFLHVAVQVPGYLQWLRRDELNSASDTARDVLHQMHLENERDETIVLMGGIAPFISLFDERIRPIDFRPEDFLEKRLESWRPRYLICMQSHLPKLRAYAPTMIRSVQNLGSFRVLDNYYQNEDQVLVRIEYAE